MKADARSLARVATVLALSTLALPIEPTHAQTGKPDLPRAPPEIVAPPLERESLSEKLDKSGGVLRPAPDIDPHMSKPPLVPDAGATPVIPAPGSPGGRQDIEPK